VDALNVVACSSTRWGCGNAPKPAPTTPKSATIQRRRFKLESEGDEVLVMK
jgi:hypothetical protein